MVSINANDAVNRGRRRKPAPSRGWPGETVKPISAPVRSPGGRRPRRPVPLTRSGPGKSPLVPVNRAEQVASMGPKKFRANSSAPGQRKKALGLKSARSLTPAGPKRGKVAPERGGNPMPGGARPVAASKAARIVGVGPKRQSPGKPTFGKRGGGMPQVSAPEVPRPGLLSKAPARRPFPGPPITTPKGDARKAPPRRSPDRYGPRR